MKKISLILLCITFTISLFGQSYTKKWNSIQQRYEYFDSRGRMFGYDKYNSITKSWEHYDSDTPYPYTKQPQTIIQPYNLDLIWEMAARKQQAYDAAISNEIARRDAEKAKIRNTINEAISMYNNAKSYPSTIPDGWHEVLAYTTPDFIAVRKVYVKGNMVTQYVVDNWAFRTVSNPVRVNNAYAAVKIKEDPTLDIRLLFLNSISNPNSISTPPEASGTISFWTDYNKSIDVWVEGQYIGNIPKYFPKEAPSCGQNGTLVFRNKAGTYSYYAESGKWVWKGTVTITANQCQRQKLLK